MAPTLVLSMPAPAPARVPGMAPRLRACAIQVYQRHLRGRRVYLTPSGMPLIHWFIGAST